MGWGLALRKKGKDVQLNFFISNEMNFTQILDKFTRFSNGKKVNKMRIAIQNKMK